MSLVNLAAAAPIGARPIWLLEVRDPAGGAPLRFADSLRPVSVSLEDGLGAATFEPLGHRAEGAAVDESALERRAIAVPDLDGVLWSRILANVGGASPMQVVVRLYRSDDLGAPLLAHTLELTEPERSADGLSVSFTAVSLDPINRDAGLSEFTESNAPGLRGRG